MALHDQRPHANLVVTDDVYVATELNAMESLAGSEQGEVVFYIGHSGWGPGQLDDEVERGDWILEPARRDDAFTSTPLGLWESVLTRKGGSYALVARMPPDPSVN